MKQVYLTVAVGSRNKLVSHYLKTDCYRCCCCLSPTAKQIVAVLVIAIGKLIETVTKTTQ